MENEVSEAPAPTKSPEQIEAEMFQTRESLTEKVAALENQVLGTVQTAANTLTETVDAVKSFVTTAPEAVSDTVEQVTNSIKDRVAKTFDISHQVQTHPFACVGASVGIGFIAAYLFPGGRGSSGSSVPTGLYSGPREPAHREAADRVPPTRESAPRTPGIFDDLMGMLGRKAKEVGETLLAAAAASLNNTIRDGVPKLIDQATQRLADTVGHAPARHNSGGEPAAPGGNVYG